MYFWGGWELRGVENRRQQFINLSLNLFSFSISFTVSFFGHYVSYYRKYILFSFCQFCLYLHLDFCVLRIVSLVYFNHLMDFVTSDKRFGACVFAPLRHISFIGCYVIVCSKKTVYLLGLYNLLPLFIHWGFHQYHILRVYLNIFYNFILLNDLLVISWLNRSTTAPIQ